MVTSSPISCAILTRYVKALSQAFPTNFGTYYNLRIYDIDYKSLLL